MGISGLWSIKVEQLIDFRIEAPRLEGELFLTREVEEISQQFLQAVALLTHKVDLCLGTAIAMLRR